MTLAAKANIAAVISDLVGGRDLVHADSQKRVPYVVGGKRE